MLLDDVGTVTVVPGVGDVDVSAGVGGHAGEGVDPVVAENLVWAGEVSGRDRFPGPEAGAIVRRNGKADVRLGVGLSCRAPSDVHRVGRTEARDRSSVERRRGCVEYPAR